MQIRQEVHSLHNRDQLRMRSKQHGRLRNVCLDTRREHCTRVYTFGAARIVFMQSRVINHLI